MTLTFGYPTTAPNRTPTTAEYNGAIQAITDWLNDSSRNSYKNSISYRYDRTTVVPTSLSRTQMVLNIESFFKAGTRSQIPLQIWYLQLVTSYDGTNLLRNLRDANPTVSIFNQVQSVSKEMVPVTPTLPPGSTLPPGTYIPPCQGSPCKNNKNKNN